MFDQKNIARLLDIANAACHVGLVLDARKIYEAILDLKPGFVPARLGLAYSYLTVDEFEQAANLLQDIVQENPQDEDAVAMLGFCCYLVGDTTQSKNLLEPLSKNASAHIVQLANDILSANNL